MHEELVAYFQSGHTMADCATKFECSAVTISRRLKAAGVIAGDSRLRSDLDWMEIKDYFLSGHPQKECAIKYDCSTETIRRGLRALDIDSALYRPENAPAHCIPVIMHNKINIDVVELSAYFNEHTLKECAAHYQCTESTIKRHLRIAGIDTSLHNNSDLARRKHREKVSINKPTPDELRQLYLPKPDGQNWDSKSIAELYGCHFNVIRAMLNKLGLWRSKTAQQKSQAQANRHFRKHGVFHPAQRKDVLAKTRRSTTRAKYTDINGRQHAFRSSHELSFAMLLDSNGAEWYYEDMSVPYVDMLSGKNRVYFIDFTVIDGDNVEWIEVKPADGMVPEDKMLYASRLAEERGVVFRCITEVERQDGYALLKSGYRSEFVERIYNKRHMPPNYRTH